MPLKKGQASKAFQEGKMEKYNFKNLPVERRKEIAANAAKKRKENAAKRKAMKEQMEMLLDLDVTKPIDKKMLKELGVDPALMNNQMLLLASLMKKGFSGDVAAFKEIRNVLEGILPEEEGQANYVIPNITIVGVNPSEVTIYQDTEDWEDEEEDEED